MSPPDMETEPCYFCNSPSQDRGRHLIQCAAARDAIPLPRRLARLSADQLEQALLLEDGAPRERLQLALEYMKTLYSARVTRRERAKPQMVRRPHISNPEFLRFREPNAVEPIRRPGSSGRCRKRTTPSEETTEDAHKRQRHIRPRSTSPRPIHEVGSGVDNRKRPTTGEERGETTTAKRTRRTHPPSPPSPSPPDEEVDEDVSIRIQADQLALLNEPCHEVVWLPEFSLGLPVATQEPWLPEFSLGLPVVTQEPSLLIPCRKRSFECSEEQGTSLAKKVRSAPLDELLTCNPPADAPVAPTDGPWTEEECEQLAEAALIHGQGSQALLARFVPTRTRRQIRVRLSTADHRRRVEHLRETRRSSDGQGSRANLADALEATSEGSTRPVPTPGSATPGDIAPTYREGRWTEEEKARLLAAVRELGRDASGETLSRAVGTRSARQVVDRLKEKSVQAQLDALFPQTSTDSATSSSQIGRWEAEEVQRLEAAVNCVRDLSRHAAIANLIGNRTAAQVAAKVGDLARAGRIKRISPSSFRIE